MIDFNLFNSGNYSVLLETNTCNILELDNCILTDKGWPNHFEICFNNKNISTLSKRNKSIEL